MGPRNVLRDWAPSRAYRGLICTALGEAWGLRHQATVVSPAARAWRRCVARRWAGPGLRPPGYGNVARCAGFRTA
jgi:hypothetical protein